MSHCRKKEKYLLNQASTVQGVSALAYELLVSVTPVYGNICHVEINTKAMLGFGTLRVNQSGTHSVL